MGEGEEGEEGDCGFTFCPRYGIIVIKCKTTIIFHITALYEFKERFLLVTWLPFSKSFRDNPVGSSWL